MFRHYPSIPILIVLCCAALSPLPAQQTAFLNQYTWNPRLFNPAAQGGFRGGEIALAYRSQFQNLDADVRPVTYLLHADVSPFTGRRLGVALQVLADKTHVLRRNQVSGFFAYHLVQHDALRISLGVQAGILNQKFDFSDVRVSDVLDVTVFNNQTAATRFDGGPGLNVEYHTYGGSFLALDVAAPQLFSSDIAVEKPAGATRRGAVYDLVPHLLATARFRYQGPGFALEPNIAYRSVSGERALQAGKFDFNLNAYFLKENRLLVGAGLRSDGGGLHFQLGLSPTRNLRLHLGGELHASLGTTYELGLGYVFTRKPRENKPVLVLGSDAVDNAYATLRVALITLDPDLSAIRNQLEETRRQIESGAVLTSRAEKMAETDKCVFRLAKSAQELERLRERLHSLDVQHKDAEIMSHDLIGRGGTIPASTQQDIALAVTLAAKAQKQYDDLLQTQNALSQQCSALRPVVTEAACVREGDAECVRDLFAQNLDAVTGRPDNMFPLEVKMDNGAALVGYRYPDDTESYILSPALRRLAGHVADRIKDATAQGLVFDALVLESDLQEDVFTLHYKTGQHYGGELGFDWPAYALIDQSNGSALEKTPALAQDVEYTLEELALLKIAALRRYFLDRGVAPGKIYLRVAYNHPENTYREETRIWVRLR